MLWRRYNWYSFPFISDCIWARVLHILLNILLKFVLINILLNITHNFVKFFVYRITPTKIELVDDKSELIEIREEIIKKQNALSYLNKIYETTAVRPGMIFRFPCKQFACYQLKSKQTLGAKFLNWIFSLWAGKHYQTQMFLNCLEFSFQMS